MSVLRNRLLLVIGVLAMMIGLLFVGPAGADQDGKALGTVYVQVLADGVPDQMVEGVEVWVREVPTGINHYACTDATGVAHFEGVVTADVELISATGKAGNQTLGCPNADFRWNGLKMFWEAYEGHSQGVGEWESFSVSAGGNTTITITPDIPTGEAQNNVCAGHQVSMWATGGLFLGTTGDDVILGTSGKDTIKALGGDDVVCGEGGNNTLIGQAGNDWLSGWSGTDNLIGKIGDDTLFDDQGLGNVLKGGPGLDLLVGGNADDTLIGGRDKDWIHGYGGLDTITGAHGNDLIWGGAENDTIYGKYGYDKVWAGDGADEVFGGDGNDALYGEGDHDTIKGGNGDDYLDGGPGLNTLIGGTQGEIAGDTCVNGYIVKSCNP